MRGVFWFLKTVIKLIFNTLGYVITLSFLSVALVTRTKIGKKAFLPWSYKLFDSEYKPTLSWPVRILTIALLHIWVRIFVLWHWFEDAPVESFTQLDTYQFIIEGYHKLFGEQMFLLQNDLFIPYLFSYFIVILGGLHLISFEFRGAVPSGSLGDSLLFGWLKERTGNISIWCWIEPFFMAFIGFMLLLVGYQIYALFFWISAGGMAFMGNDIRMKKLDTYDGVAGDIQSGKSLAKKQKKEKEKTSPSKTPPPSDNDGAVIIID